VIATRVSQAPVHVVLHGGLGNQLFQLFAGRLEASPLRKAVVLCTQQLGQYAVRRHFELSALLPLAQLDCSVCARPPTIVRARIPKILLRIGLQERALYVPGFGLIMDGYFQSPNFYDRYGLSSLASEIRFWLSLMPAPSQSNGALARSVLCHIRLGDFFPSQRMRADYVRKRVAEFPEPPMIITDDELLVGSELSKRGPAFANSLVSTKGMTGFEVLQIMRGYRHIVSNGSSLAFWAAALSARAFTSTNAAHVALWRQFSVLRGARDDSLRNTPRDL
jgi:hypothetical protein